MLVQRDRMIGMKMLDVRVKLIKTPIRWVVIVPKYLLIGRRKCRP